MTDMTNEQIIEKLREIAAEMRESGAPCAIGWPNGIDICALALTPKPAEPKLDCSDWVRNKDTGKVDQIGGASWADGSHRIGEISLCHCECCAPGYGGGHNHQVADYELLGFDPLKRAAEHVQGQWISTKDLPELPEGYEWAIIEARAGMSLPPDQHVPWLYNGQIHSTAVGLHCPHMVLTVRRKAEKGDADG